jgi:hypothetical protein
VFQFGYLLFAGEATKKKVVKASVDSVLVSLDDLEPNSFYNVYVQSVSANNRSSGNSTLSLDKTGDGAPSVYIIVISVILSVIFILILGAALHGIFRCLRALLNMSIRHNRIVVVDASGTGAVVFTQRSDIEFPVFISATEKFRANIPVLKVSVRSRNSRNTNMTVSQHCRDLRFRLSVTRTPQYMHEHAC